MQSRDVEETLAFENMVTNWLFTWTKVYISPTHNDHLETKTLHKRKTGKGHE